MKNRVFHSPQSGQVGIMIILTMTVLLTVGLSIATRSSQDLSVETQQTDSTRVFNAAEAGVEEALSKIMNGQYEGGSVASIANTDVNYTIDQSSQLQTKLFEGKSIKIDLTGATFGNYLNINWSRITDCGSDPASLVVNIFYDDAGTIKVRHLGYAACDHGDGLTVASSGSSPYFKEANIPLFNGDLMAHIQPVYNDTDVRVAGGNWTLPTQSYVVRSQADNTTGNETRIIEVSQTLDTVPTVFDYALYSGGTIVK